MAKTIAPLLPSTTTLLLRFGDRLRLARLRRRLTARQVAERAGMAPMTLRSLERGGSGVTMGAYLAVMQVLGVEKDLDLLGAADLLGRELQDARMTTQGRRSVRNVTSAAVALLKRGRSIAAGEAARERPAPAKTIKAGTQYSKSTAQWIAKSGFNSARTLVDLIDTKGGAPKNRR